MKLSSFILITSAPLIAYLLISGQVTLHYVVTGSMEPSIPVGSLVVAMKDIQFSQGDVVVYSMGDFKLMHRVSGVLPNGLLVTADAQPEYLELVGWERVRGKVVAALPLLGYPFLSLSAIPFLILAIGVLLLYPVNNRADSLFWFSALTVVAMATLGDTGLASLGRPLAVFLASAVTMACRFLEVRSEGAVKQLVQLNYILLAAACLSSISREAVLRGVGL